MASVREAYGLDLGPTHAVVVCAAAGRRDVSREVIWNGLPTDPQLAELGAGIAAEVAAGRARTAAAMPVHEVVTRWLTTPFPSISKAMKVLPSLLDIQLPFPLETCVYDLIEVQTHGGHVRALAVATRKDHLRTRLETCRGLGLDPVVLDHEGLALWTQSIGELPVEADTLRVVAHVGHDHSVLVLGRGLSLVSAHGCRRGLNDLLVQGRADPQAVGEFVDRARRVLRAELDASAEHPVQWVWTGPGAAEAACVDALREALALGPAAKFLAHREPAPFLARALAERALADGARPQRGGPALLCNFRAGDLVHPQQRRMETAGRVRVAAAYLALGLLLCALSLAWRVILHYRDAAAQTALTSLAQELTGGGRVERGQEVLLARRAVEDRRPLDAAFVEAFQPSLTVLLAGLLDVARDGGVVLDTLSLRRDAVSATGSGEDWPGGRGLAQFLEESGFEVEFKPQDAAADERVHFTLKGVAKP
ncbi:MAG: hypothetical protein JXB04_03900 [Kiritimatiellae bacterium]|nr:hypothetical protein [Kiritimatiellia bacterium]